MNTQATKQQIQVFGNKPGTVMTHKEPNRAERRRKEKPRRGQVHLLGGARIPPQLGEFLKLTPAFKR